ncbi:MAG: hypothetical protein GXO80_12055 [Chlorobi bacterium]|nr:hypothetical protein [Chlorobiota bacterium]
MALTINRNNEITSGDFKFLKQKFKEKTNTRALYKCVEYVVQKLPDYEKQIEKLTKENNRLKIKHNHLIEIIKRKQFVDQELDKMVYPVETA